MKKETEKIAAGSVGTVTSKCMSDLWAPTGYVLVKMSARLGAPCRHVTIN